LKEFSKVMVDLLAEWRRADTPKFSTIFQPNFNHMSRAIYQWNELSPLLTKHNIPTSHALSAGMVTVRIAMDANPSDLPPGYARPLKELKADIKQNMQSYLSLIGVPELYVMCCKKRLWTPQQLQIRAQDGEMDITHHQLDCIQTNALQL